MIYQVWHSGEGVNNESIHVEWIKPQNYNVNADYTYNKIITGREIPNDIRLPLLTTAKGAKLVDYLSTPGMDSLTFISENVIDLFRGILLPNHSLLDMNIDGNLYFGLHFEEVVTNKLVNWSKTKFYIRSKLNQEISRTYLFKNYDDFKENSKQLMIDSVGKSNFKPSKIQFNIIEYDLFYSIPPVGGLFCSQKFVDLVKDQNISGFKFESVSKRFPIEGTV